MPYSCLIVEKSAGVATLTLNRPEAMNALSAELRGEITSAFRELAKDRETRIVILTGAGRAFCAGMDLKELANGERGGDAAAYVPRAGRGHAKGRKRCLKNMMWLSLGPA